jgi:hypothetical protein
MLTPDEAVAAGLTIDSHCYPNVAYSGPRFQPAHITQCMTSLEASLSAALKAARAEIDRLNEARRIDTLTTSHYCANVALYGLWKMLGANNQTEASQKLRELLKT